MTPGKEILLHEIREHIEGTNVNLGRKTAKRTKFIEDLLAIIDQHVPDNKVQTEVTRPEAEEAPKPVLPKPDSKVVDQRMMVTKSKKANRMRIGDGSHSISESESMRGDQQLGRSPLMGE